MKNSSMQTVELIFMKFELFFGKVWNDKFKAEDAETSAIKYNLLKTEFAKAVSEFSEERVENAIDHVRDNCKFPPNIAEFREACRNSGQCKISEENALRAAINRDFSNPVVRLAFDKIGSWEFSHAQDRELRQKFKWAYRDAVDQVNCSGSEQYDCERNKPLLSSGKIDELLPHQDGGLDATGKEFGAEKTILRVDSEGNCKVEGKKPEIVQNLDRNLKVDETGKFSRWWSPTLYESRFKTFDKNIYRERREFLCALSEEAVLDRSYDDRVDRNHYLSEKYAWEFIQQNKREWAMRNPGGEEPVKNDRWKGKSWRKDIYD